MDFHNGGSTSSTGSDSNSSDWVAAFNAGTGEGRAARWDPTEYSSLISEARNSKLYRKEWERCIFEKMLKEKCLSTKATCLSIKSVDDS